MPRWDDRGWDDRATGCCGWCGRCRPASVKRPGGRRRQACRSSDAFGYFTKSDLSGWGKTLSMLLIGLAIALVVNMFWGNSTLNLITSFVGVILFTALAAYDTQKLKQIAFLGVTDGEEMHDKASILGALTLYLDFVNLFLFLLRFFGRRR